MKVFITKYALSEGILVGEGNRWEDYVNCNFDGRKLLIGKRDWHPTMVGAVDKAESMRLKKIASLEKQINKLKALVFE